MKLFIGCFLFFSLGVLSLPAQVPSDAASDAARMESVLKEAGELQTTEPQSVAEKLAPLLTELRRLRENGALKPDTSRIFKDTLLLMMRTQTMLLAPEQEIQAFIRDLLIVDPKIDEGTFNPREKLLLKKVRSTEAGTLTLETTPPGAVLYYLGTELGTTPGKFELIAGSYRLQLRLPGYLDQNIDLTIQPAEAASLSRTMRRRVIDIPVGINAPQTTIRLNGKTLGTSQAYKTWLASLPSEQQPEYESIIGQWKIDPSASSFFRLVEVPVDQTVRIEFQAACYQPLVLEIKLADQDVDWTRTVFVAPQLRNVHLTNDSGSVEVSSTPSGAEVWVDGGLLGQTPLVGKEFCAGTHRVQILHTSGQHVQEISIQRGRTSRINGQLKPALAFLGVYERTPGSSELRFAAAESRSVSRSLALTCRAFSDPLIMPEDIEALYRKGSLPVARLVQEQTAAGDMDGQIRKASAAAGRSELLLLGLRTEKGYVFKLYSTLHPIPDSIELPGLDDSSINFLISQMNKTERVRERLQVTDFGVELSDSPRGLVISSVHSAVASRKTALAPGLVVKSIDEKSMSFAESQQYLRTKKPEQTVVLEVQAGKDKVSLVPVALRRVGAEYPWSTPDGFANSVLATLRHLVERDPLSDEAKFAALSLARGFMKFKEWRLALEYLARANFDLQKSGICPGTVLYYQGRCYEEMGNQAQAQIYYARAKEYAEATLGTNDGISIPVLADQRLQAFKRR